MNQRNDRRACERLEHRAPVVFAYRDSDQFHQARICNLCPAGMCFETETAVAQGSEIYIMMENYAPDDIGAEIYDGYFARVCWCRASPEGEKDRYQVGVQYYRSEIR
jgi:hypothetical protein